MRVDAATIEEYFAAAGDREKDLRAIDVIISDAAPQLKRQLFSGPSITMIGYGEMSWERPSGSGVWPLIGLALQNLHFSIYVAAMKDGETLAARYADRLGKTDNGKNCIRFSKLPAIDSAELANAVRDAVAWAEVQEERFGRNCAVPVDRSVAARESG